MAASATLLVGACLPGGESDAGRSSSSSSESTGGDEESGTEELEKPEQRQVDARTAKKALPTRSDMPDKTWLVDVSSSSSAPRYDPKVCAATRLSSDDVRTFKEEHRTVEEKARFSQYERHGGEVLAVYLESYDQPFPLSYFDEAGADMAQCESFTETYEGSDPSAMKASAIATPAVGDRAFGVRVKSPRIKPVDRLYVRSGHNLIIVMHLSQEEDSLDVDLLEKHARAVLDRLQTS